MSETDDTGPGAYVRRGSLQAQLKALCKLLQDEGHMTPMATRQILLAVEEHRG